MARKKYYPSNEYPYHVTVRTWNRQWFGVPLSVVWMHFCNYLHFVWRAYDVRIHAFVLMDNHIHLVISTPEANLKEVMNYLLREVSKRLNEETGRINQVFGGPYHWSLIKDPIHYQHVYKYVYRNPVEAKLCKRVEEYSYSSLPGVLGLDYLYVPVYDNLDLHEAPAETLDWLNTSVEQKVIKSIEVALKHREFSFARDDETAKIHLLNTQVI